jgi:hypothetical protein
MKTSQPTGPSHALLDLARPVGNGADGIRGYLNDIRHERPRGRPLYRTGGGR